MNTTKTEKKARKRPLSADQSVCKRHNTVVLDIPSGKGDSRGFVDFDSIQISTRTEIVISNLVIDLHKLHKNLPIFELEIPRYLKNKKEIIRYISNYPQQIPYGSIITSELENNVRGFKIKKRKQWDEETKSTHFRNAIALVMYLDKLINIKIPKKGKIQITGCGKESHVYECLKQLWNYLSPTDIYSLDKDSGYNYLHFIIRTVMTNKDFNLGFKIDRENLDKYINTHTRFHSLLETSVGYTGVNIKAPYEHSNTAINTLSFRNGNWEENTITYFKYLEVLDAKDRKKELNKKKKNTFLTFYSGSCIMSGMNTQYMHDTFYEFINIIKNARSVIEEDVSKFS